MFIGHFALGYGAKKAAPSISLGWLFIAVQFLDLLWPTLLLLGVENLEINNDPNSAIHLTFTDYPVSHSLVMAIVWSLVLGFIYWLLKKNTRSAIIIAVCVASHWLLDFIVHYPDLPLTLSGTSKEGLALWSRPILENIIEGIMFILGFAFYMNATKSKNAKGRYLPWILAGLLAIAHIANFLSPPPPSVTAVAWGAELVWLFVILAFWCDANRTIR